MTKTKKEIIQAVLKLHNPAAQNEAMVYEVWEDGEITLTKGGEIYGHRKLHLVANGIPEKALPVDALPLQNHDGTHSRIQCMTAADAKAAHMLITQKEEYSPW